MWQEEGVGGSFYGSSYIHVPLQDAKSTTDIHFRFKTKRPDSFLVLVAGRTDYCIIRLEFGKLKVRINLGAGESEISSARGLKLDDLNWHDVAITRRDAEFVLVIDNIHITKEKLPGRFYELNIHYGIFLGGQGDFTELFLGHHDSLRGCLSDVEYNGINVLKKARERLGQVDVQGVTWSCSSEFEAGFDTDVSFVENGAFMTLPNLITRTGARWEFYIKISSPNGLLLYNTGLTSKSDYVGVEMVDSHLRLIVDRGNGAAELISEESISDGYWHFVSVYFTPTLLELVIDRKTSSVQLTPTGNRYLDLDVADVMFIGGMELNKRARALGQGIKSADVSIKGCLRNMTFDGRRTGLPDAKVTVGLLPDCVWEYPCQKDPCVLGSVCVQQGVESFKCECDHPPCIKPEYSDEYKIFSKISLPIDLEIVKLVPLVTEEGKNSLITTDNIDVVLDYRKYGVRDSGLLFRILKPPEFGKILAENWDKHGTQRQIFTLLDVSKDKIRYLHDGSENHHDRIVFDMELSPESGFLLPGYLQGRHRFVLHVNVTPVNDPPSLELGPGKVLRLAQGTKKILSKDLLNADDPDSSTGDLVYTVLNQGGRSDEKGYLERLGKPGVKVDSFTQKEVDNRVIVYVHTGKESPNSRLALQVSDGIETSPPVFLRISSFPLEIRLLNNTGIVLTHKSFVKITSYNLTFVTNADDPTLEIRYDVTKLPQYGVLQRLINLENAEGPYNASLWQIVEHFTSQQIAREEIRYMHTSQSPMQDFFKFKVSVAQIKNPTEYDFRITFTKLTLEPSTLRVVYLNGTKDVTITERELEYTTKPLVMGKKNIIYKILSGPKYGFLTLMTNKRRHLQGGDAFTQEDIERERLRYRLHRKGYSHIKDDFTFQATAQDTESNPQLLTIIHIPTLKVRNDVHVTLEGLQVDEGGRQVLLPTHLDLRASVITSLVYNLTQGPGYGRIDIMDKSLQNVQRRNTSYFTSDELFAERVYYIHDDSETRNDHFNFIALSSEEEDFQFVGEFHVNVVLKNDNTPVRVVDKVFNVVTNGERLLTGRDLKYTDADIDTKPSDIMYTRRGIPNGGLYLAEEPSKAVFEFSQDDLDKGIILFRHEGSEYGKIGLWITDGQYYANGVLEVKASPPYILVNDTGLVVQTGGVTFLTAAHLYVDTNLNVQSDAIVYRIKDQPKHGHLILFPEEEKLRTFTQLQLERKKIAYSHVGDTAVKDTFRFEVSAQGTTVEGIFNIKIYPSSFWEELLTRNNTVYVEESTSITITNYNLEVMHPNIAASDIIYYVVRQPLFGTLEIDSFAVPEDGKEDYKAVVKVFEQSVINDHQLHYVQEIANQTEDLIVVDVTNGITWIRGLELHIVVIPEFIYLLGGEFECLEGDSVQLPNSLFVAQNEYYRNKITEYEVVEKPKHGIVYLSKYSETSVSKFTKQQFENGLVRYLHDGSETTNDEFSVVGKTDEKESLAAAVKIKIIEINDQKPVLVNNKGLELWEGSSAIITPLNLAVTDEDTPPQNIMYTVSSVKTGHLALVTNPNKPIQHFSQAQINSNQILFLHKGGQFGKFQFHFTDGESTSEKMNFNITAKVVKISMVNNERLQIFPTLKKAITSDLLLAVTSDHTTSRGNSISYVLKRKPDLGRIVFKESNGNFVEVDRFTQMDVNDTKVWYQQTKKFKNLHAKDSFTFDVHAEFTHALVEQLFDIDISVSSGGLEHFLAISPIVVKEGESKTIRINTDELILFLTTQAGLDAPTIQVHLLRRPTHGKLCYRSECNVTVFSQNQMNVGDVVYQHDNSDTLADEVEFAIYLEPGDVLLCNLTLPVKIIPVNDQPFSIITLSPRLTVVQGQKYVLSKQDLLTEDADTPPEEIVYDIINGPSQGVISVSRSNSTEAESSGRFTQMDVNVGNVAYTHSGPILPTSFYFRVSDGKFNPTYTVFNIHVLPLTLNISSLKPVYLEQCSSVAVVTTENFQIETNGDHRNIKYNVTRNPKNGVIYLGDVPSNYFTQNDLENKKVMYMQTIMTAPGDSFQLSGWIVETNSPPKVDVSVVIKPLLVTGIFVPFVGSKNRLGLSVLDASPLAKVTNSNPVYQVLKKPKLGRLKKIIRSSGERKNIKEKEILKFSHEELKSGVIYFVTRKSLTSDEGAGLEDSMSLSLSAPIFQPAKVDLKFRVVTEGNSSSTTLDAILQSSKVPDTKNSVGHEGGIRVASPNIKSDYILIVGMIVGVLLLAIIVVIVVRCRTVKKEERKSKKQDLQGPMPLPRPPDDLMPSAGRLKTFSSSNGSTSNSIPQCKVIPLGPVDSITSSDFEINARYPYGISDEPVEDWSSYDASEPGYPQRTLNPMLRRNQYWV
ncbi:hypothetical protein RUM43_004284 [Polyplax serrata]|uniref:Laminin G domain-containing protein n=1 Tax=Polyplax serrata TaxID=468196 RepID=A0AAN8SAS5_POLSC